MVDILCASRSLGDRTRRHHPKHCQAGKVCCFQCCGESAALCFRHTCCYAVLSQISSAAGEEHQQFRSAAIRLHPAGKTTMLKRIGSRWPGLALQAVTTATAAAQQGSCWHCPSSGQVRSGQPVLCAGMNARSLVAGVNGAERSVQQCSLLQLR